MTWDFGRRNARMVRIEQFFYLLIVVHKSKLHSPTMQAISGLSDPRIRLQPRQPLFHLTGLDPLTIIFVLIGGSCRISSWCVQPCLSRVTITFTTIRSRCTFLPTNADNLAVLCHKFTIPDMKQLVNHRFKLQNL
jgi:hypothetical protein